MGYVTLHFKQGGVGLVRQNYDLSQVFQPLIQTVVQDLLRRKILNNGDYYLPYIVPRYDTRARFGHEKVRLQPWTDASPNFEELNNGRKGWLSADQIQGKPMAYFSLHLRTIPSQGGNNKSLVYQRDFPLSDLQSIVDETIRELHRQGKWSRQEIGDVEWTLTAHFEPIELRSEQHEHLATLVIITSPMIEREASISPEVPPSVLAGSKQFSQMQVWPRQRPEVQRAIGNPQTEQIQIYIHREAIVAIERVAKHTFDREQAGILVGQPGEDAEGGAWFVEVMAVIPARRVQATAQSVAFSPKAWEDVQSQISAHHPDKQIMGWYHIHLGGTLFSESDMAQHRLYFARPCQVALVFDVLNRQIFLYHLDSTGIRALSGFYEV